MAIDPFAVPEPDEAQAETVSAPQAPSTAVAAVETDQNYVTVILKGGTGYGAPSISIRGANVADALEQVQAYANELKELVDRVTAVSKYFSVAVDGNNPSGRGGAKGGPAGQPAASKEAPGGEKRYCEHGQREYKTGVTKTGKNAGKTWEAFDCKDGVCDREWKN